MKYLTCVFVIYLSLSCSSDLDTSLNNLADYVSGSSLQIDNVIACAASNVDSSLISIFFYPRKGVNNIQCFVSNTADDDKNDYSKYTKLEAPVSDVFNGYLMKFDAYFESEKWVIVSFEENGKIHLSNPIRLKEETKPTEYLPENTMVDNATIMPTFSWEDGVYTDTKIYFQIVSFENNDLISGTYTYDRWFQFYNLDNVVLNITNTTPANLEQSTVYNFTLMAVSEDNWVNMISTKSFLVE